jgi:quercetin dioxygenase-like cupin family protein
VITEEGMTRNAAIATALACALTGALLLGSRLTGAGEPASSLLLKTEIQGYELFVQRIALPPGATGTAHDHAGHEIIYVLDGRATIRTGDLVTTVEAGEVFHVAPGTVMSAENPSQASESQLLVFFLAEH